MGRWVWWEVVVERCSRTKSPHVQGPPAQDVAAVGMDLSPRGGDGLLEPHITIKGTLHRLSPCSAQYPPPAPDRAISGVTSSTNSSLTSKYSEHLKAFLSQQTSFSTLKPLLASPSNRCKTKKTQSQKPTYRAAPSETEGTGGKLLAVAEMKDAAMTFC